MAETKELTPEQRAEWVMPPSADAMRDEGFTSVRKSAGFRADIALQIRYAEAVRDAAHAAEVAKIAADLKAVADAGDAARAEVARLELDTIHHQREAAEWKARAEWRSEKVKFYADEAARLEREHAETMQRAVEGAIKETYDGQQAEVQRLARECREAQRDREREHDRRVQLASEVEELRARLATAPAGWSVAKARAAEAVARSVEIRELGDGDTQIVLIGDIHAAVRAFRAIDAEPQPAQQGGRDEAREALARMIQMYVSSGSLQGSAAWIVDALDRYLAARKEA